MQNIYTVGQVNSYIKNMFTQDFALNRISIKGEVSNCKYHSTGHIYFTLKDETGTIAGVMFAGQRKGLAFPMKEGQRVVAFGSVNVYERDGKYQLYAKEIHLDGAGELFQKFEELKKNLEEMGMFSNEYKQQIPKFIKTLGIVTAPTGAAIRDIMNVSIRRNPYIQLILFPALVQGAGAAFSIAKGIEVLDEYGVDTIIVGRGGGSIEDLWAFNEERVARAIFNCKTPIISAVGHETDFTIADFVADLRAPTPSAGAELAVADVSLLQDKILEYEQNLRYLLYGKITDVQNKVDRYQLKLKFLSPENQIREKRQYAIDMENKLLELMKNVIQNKRFLFELYIEKMNGLSPLNKLNQGYSFVADSDGKAIYDIDKVEIDELVKIHVLNGNLDARIINKEKVRRSYND